MRALIVSLALCLGLGAQSISINAAGPAIPPFQADQFFQGGVVWVDPTMGTGILETLRYAPSFSYNIPLQNGFYLVKIDLLEPNKTGTGQRVFTVTANGIQSDPIDVFAITKAINIPTSVTLLVMVGNGHLRIGFHATSGNAMVSAIEVNPYQASLLAIGIPCTAPASGSTDGAIIYAQVPDGSCLALVAIPAPDVLQGFSGAYQTLYVKIPGTGTVSPIGAKIPAQNPQ